MTTKKGVWNLQQVRDKQLQSLWTYSSTNGELWSWGYNEEGQLGLNDIVSRSSPVQIGSAQSWENLGNRGRRNNGGGAIKDDGTLWMWGRNQYGGLGQNDITQRSSPVQVPGTTWDKFSAGVLKGAAIKTDGTLWVWGRNDTGDYAGQLGQNNKTNYSSPVQIPGTTWQHVSSGGGSMTAIKTDGTLWAWGGNVGSGQLGQNNLTKYSSPVQIPGTTWNHTWAGADNTFATKTDGTLWGIGRNDSGQLAQNDTVQRSSPIQIPGTWAIGSNNQIGIGYFRVAATKTDGTLWAWGNNSQGQLGQNSTTTYSSPIQVGSDTTWSVIQGGGVGFGAIKTDGTLWTWGRNQYGGLGQNDRTYRSSPVQIPGTWKIGEGALSLGSYCVQAIKLG